MKRKVVLSILLTVLFYVECNAWGAKGHKIVAQVAKSCLEQPIIDSVQHYLGNMSFEEASVWMDEVRGDHSYDYLKPWHYVNVEKDKTYVKVKEPNVVNQIEWAIEELKKNRGNKDKMSFALKVLFHLVGDLHQPLHCGYADDKGGNEVQVRFYDRGSNLHKVWDSAIIERYELTTNDVLKYSGTLPKKEKDEMQSTDVVAWCNESRELLNGVYDFTNNKLGSDYSEKNLIVIKKQLLSAGVRLATILNKSFKK